MQLKSLPRLQRGQSLCPESVVIRRDVPTTTKIFPRRLCVPCGLIVSPTTLRRITSTQKGDCMYVLCGRKEDGARGNSFLSAKYSYAYVHTASLSKTRSVAPQNHQTISEAKHFSNSCEQFRVLFILKKTSILNFENPLFFSFSSCFHFFSAKRVKHSRNSPAFDFWCFHR